MGTFELGDRFKKCKRIAAICVTVISTLAVTIDWFLEVSLLVAGPACGLSCDG